MSSQDQKQSGDERHEQFDNPEVGSGVRDTGTDAPEQGQAGRPVGTVDEDKNPPLSDPTASDVYGGRASCPRKTPAPRSRRMKVELKAQRTNPQAAGEMAVQTSAARGAPSRIPTTSRRPGRPQLVVQRSLRPTSNRRRRRRSRTVTTTGSGPGTFQGPAAASPRAKANLGSCAKVIGAARGRPGAFRPKSVVNIGAMSFGSLSGSAVEALNRGAVLADCLHNTVRAAFRAITGTAANSSSSSVPPTSAAATPRAASTWTSSRRWSPARRCGPWRSSSARAASRASRAVTRTQGVRRDRGRSRHSGGARLLSPSRHAEFSDTDSLLDWVELLAAETGLPVGIKSAVGDLDFWHELTDLMRQTERGVDFVTIDGGEGGTGAAPLIFTDLSRCPSNSASRGCMASSPSGVCMSRLPSSAAASSAYRTTRWSASPSAAT